MFDRYSIYLFYHVISSCYIKKFLKFLRIEKKRSIYQLSILEQNICDLSDKMCNHKKFSRWELGTGVPATVS